MRKLDANPVFRSANRLSILIKRYQDMKRADYIPVIKREISLLARRAIKLWWDTSSWSQRWNDLRRLFRRNHEDD